MDTDVVTERPSSLAEKIEKAIGVLAVIIVLLHATQWGLPGKLSMVTPADPFVALAFGLWLLDIALRGKWARVLQLPIATALLIVWAGLSLLPSLKGAEAEYIKVARSEGIRDIAQFIEYLVAGYLVFAYAVMRRKMAKVLMTALGAATTVVLILALIQYFRSPDTVPAMAVCGTFGNRNVLGGFLAAVIPLLMGYALFRGGWEYILWASLLAIAALVVMTSGGALAAMALGLLLVTAMRNRWLPLAAGAVGLTILLVALPHIGREDHLKMVSESIAPYRKSDLAHALGTRQDEARGLAEGPRKSVGKLRTMLIVQRNPDREELIALSRQLPDEAHFFWPWQQRYQEWQAALNMVIASPLFGVGAGSYQTNVNTYRQYQDGFPLPGKLGAVNLMEHDALSMYTVLAACLGLPGLFALVWLLMRHAGMAVRGSAADDPVRRGIAAGSLGALAGIMPAACFTDYFARGLGLTLALVLALAVSHASASRKDTEKA